MIYVRIHVGVEAVLVGRQVHPGGGGHGVGQLDFHDGLGALEAVFPRNHCPDGGAVGVGHQLAIHARGKDRQRIHGFIQAQALYIGPGKTAVALPRHLLRSHDRREFHELGLGRRFHFVQQQGHGETDPGYHHGPCLHAAQPIDALFLGEVLD